MIHPDGIGSQSNRPKTGRAALFVVAALVIVVGFLAMGSLSPAEPIAVETTTTTRPAATTTTSTTTTIDRETFNVDQITRGEPLVWGLTMAIDDDFPIALLDHDGWIYLFSTERPNFSGFEEGGLRAWRTTDGASWVPLGQVIAQPHVITHISSTGQGLVALEWGQSGEGFTVWRSDDGKKWVPETVPIDGLSRLTAVAPFAVAGTDDLLVVASGKSIQLRPLIEEALGTVPSYGWGTNVVGSELQIEVYGPAGFTLSTLTATEIGLTSEEADEIIASYSRNQQSSVMWTKRDGEPWTQSEIPDAAIISSLVAKRRGEMLAYGWGSSGFTSWSTRNGSEWEESTTSSGPQYIDTWADSLVGPAITGSPSVVVSDGDGSWEDIGPGPLFPSGFGWFIRSMASGPGGVAAMITGLPTTASSSFVSPVTLTTGDATLTIHVQEGMFTLETRDGARHNWSMSGTVPDGVEADFDTGIISFYDPHTGDLLASFAMDDIAEAVDSYFFNRPRGSERFHVFAFTPDGVDWTIQNGEVFGDANVGSLEVTDSRVIALVVSDAGRFHSTRSPGFEVWSAEIP